MSSTLDRYQHLANIANLDSYDQVLAYTLDNGLFSAPLLHNIIEGTMLRRLYPTVFTSTYVRHTKFWLDLLCDRLNRDCAAVPFATIKFQAMQIDNNYVPMISVEYIEHCGLTSGDSLVEVLSI